MAEDIRIVHHEDGGVWGFTSPDIPGLFGGGDSYAEAREMAEGGVHFALEREDVTIDHYLPERFVAEPARGAA